jgi:hypothetical protein
LHHRRIIAALLVTTLGLESCSSLREIPRAELADLPEQRDVEVETRGGIHYEFDSARFGPDSLWGFVRADTGGTVTELATTPLALDEVARVAARRTDWYRTGLLAIGALGAGIAFAVSQNDKGGSNGGSEPIKPPPTLAHSRRR